jgi:SNF2 family DNA or RNA helicase
MDSKYYAYYVSKHKPLLMNDIKEQLRTECIGINRSLIVEQVEANLYLNDWNMYLNETLHTQCLNSLVLVKFTLVNDIFIKNNEIDRVKYKEVIKNKENSKQKIVKRDYSHYKLRDILFSGTQKPIGERNNEDGNNVTSDDSNINYIFSETIIINLDNILNYYIGLTFDSNININSNKENKFDKQLKHYLKNGEMANNYIYNILQLTNNIISKVKYDSPYENYQHIREYVPLINTELSNNIIKSIWEDIYKQPDDPYEFIKNHKLITTTEDIVIDYSKPNNQAIQAIQNIQNNQNPLYIIKCPIHSKLYMTTKKFSDINYQDALPFRAFFTTKETTLSNIDKKHNSVLEKISYIEAKIANINRAKAPTDYNLRIQNNDMITSLKNDIVLLKTQLNKINPYYKQHILFNSPVGYRLTYQHTLDKFSSLLYLRYVCNNKSRLNNNFLFSYSPIDNIDNIDNTGNNNNIENDNNENNIINNIHQQHNHNFHNITYDIMSLYVSKELINDIISLKTVADIFTISRFFKISMDDKYNETGFETSRAQTSYEYEENQSTKTLTNYIKNNVALDLFNYQQNNVLWMLKIEDDIDSHNLTVNSYVGKFEINYDHIEDIKIFIYNLRARVPEAILKNYVIMHNGRKHVIDIRQTATIAQSASIMSLLNTDHYRENCVYDFESDIIEKIVPIDDYIKSHSKPIELCGGALCDEVGLGKTLSIISHLVVKMQHDMYKYSRYQNKMKEVVEKIKVNPKMHFDDPLLDYGFEFNNLIIVPSRLTSQWESEIEKYVKNKFNLRAKVLVGIASVKILEKELHDFYNKKQKNIKKDNKNTTYKEKINKKSTCENIDIDNDIEIKPIIESKVNLDIDININIDIKIKENVKSNNDEKPIEEKLIEEKPIGKPIKKTKEQLMIEKLMKNAKKANDKIRDGKNSKDEPIKNIITIPTTTTKSTKTTFDSLFNLEEDEIIKPIKPIEPISNIVPNKYEFLNKYLDIEDIQNHSKAYKEDQLYDIYIVSLNLLSNENYLNHILHNPANHFSPYTENTNTNNNNTNTNNNNTNTNTNNDEANLFKNKKIINLYKEPRQICRYTDKFNIFKIKWNRVILDEAHEQLAPVIKMFSTSIKNYFKGSTRIHLEDQILFENLCIINSNYKWAMTGTPSEKGIDNIMGILQFLTKKNYSESVFAKIEKIRYMSDIIGIAKPNMDSLLSRVFKKTLKKDVKALLNIPIFTEEIIFVEQTNIERNIYNTIRCSTHFNEATKIRRLFLMCTNILINEGYDLDNNNEITTEILTLEQLNANMIGKFNQQLKQLGIMETCTVQQIENLIVHIQDWIKIYTYIYGLHLDEKVINPEILKEIKERFSELDRPGIRNQTEIFYSVLNIFECWHNLENIGNVLLTNISTIKDYLNRIWRVSWNQTWNDEIVLTKCAEYGARLGEIRANEELVKARKALDGIGNDKRRINNQISLFSSNEFIKEKSADPCIICFEDLNQIVVTPCRHVFCLDCIKRVSNDLKTHFTCPECRTAITCNTLNITSVEMIKNAEKKKEEDEKKKAEADNNTEIESTEITKVKIPKTAIEKKLGIDWKAKCVNKYGSKMASLVEYLYKLFENKQNKCIIFSQYDKMLRMIGVTLDEFDIKFVYCHGNNYVVNKNINKFKKDESIRVIMLSSESSNSGSNLTEANNIIFIDVLFNNCETVKAIETQAIGRAVRLGQKLPVKIIRFITKGTVEEEHFNKNKYDINSLQS